VINGRLTHYYNTKDKFRETAKAWRRAIHIFMYQSLAHMTLHIIFFHDIGIVNIVKDPKNNAEQQILLWVCIYTQ
jgi:hypothetical protein